MPVHAILADVVLALHAAIVAFVVGGLPAIVVANRSDRAARWRWVDGLWFRLAHLGAIGFVVTESWLGIVCPLTTLEMFLRDQAHGTMDASGFVAHWLHRAIYFDAPGWVFTAAYSLFGALVVSTWWFLPPRRRPLAATIAGQWPGQAIVSTVPPSTRSAAPVVADACSEHT